MKEMEDKLGSARGGGEAGGVEADWSLELDGMWTEVSLLLRKPIKSEGDMMYTAAAAEAGIIFTEEVG
ncbi:hypothetical protein EON65_35615 [archaeon]|nr:MAG: hypothetical protein EON65_35615 [archaeon]